MIGSLVGDGDEGRATENKYENDYDDELLKLNLWLKHEVKLELH